MTVDEADRLLNAISDLDARYESRPSSLAAALLAAAHRDAQLATAAKRRAHIFVGKRPSARDALLEADNEDEDLADYIKRSRMFVGRRRDPAEEGWMPAEAAAAAGEMEKRPRMFVGKKHAPVFVGKRSVE